MDSRMKCETIAPVAVPISNTAANTSPRATQVRMPGPTRAAPRWGSSRPASRQAKVAASTHVTSEISSRSRPRMNPTMHENINNTRIR